MLTKMIETLKKNPRTIVYTEGTDKRILESAHRLDDGLIQESFYLYLLCIRWYEDSSLMFQSFLLT